MQVLCIPSFDIQSDVQCPCCNRRYRLYYAGHDQAERLLAFEAVQTALLDHHTQNPAAMAHPEDAFTVPHFRGPVHTCAAALLSGAPIRRPARTAPAPVAPSPIALVPTTPAQLGQRRVS